MIFINFAQFVLNARILIFENLLKYNNYKWINEIDAIPTFTTPIKQSLVTQSDSLEENNNIKLNSKNASALSMKIVYFMAILWTICIVLPMIQNN